MATKQVKVCDSCGKDARYEIQSLVLKLTPWANWLSARYGGVGVYLVGSALDKQTPNDVDIAVDIPDDLFKSRFGLSSSDFPVENFWSPAYSLESTKVAKEAQDLLRLPVDLQLQPHIEFQSYCGARIQLNMNNQIDIIKSLGNVFILRGLPGSGKSTLAKHLEKSCGAVVLSTDNYHIDPDGVYRFKGDKIGAFHRKVKRTFLQLLAEAESESPAPFLPLVVDNTNTTVAEIAYFYDLAETLGFSPVIVTVTADPDQALARNIHGIPPERFGYMEAAMHNASLPPWWKHVQIDSNDIPKD